MAINLTKVNKMVVLGTVELCLISNRHHLLSLYRDLPL